MLTNKISNNPKKSLLNIGPVTNPSITDLFPAITQKKWNKMKIVNILHLCTFKMPT